jgi:hypothetical protein
MGIHKGFEQVEVTEPSPNPLLLWERQVKRVKREQNPQDIKISSYSNPK